MSELAFTRTSMPTHTLPPATLTMPDHEYVKPRANGHNPDAGADASVLPRLESLLPASSGNIASGEWDDLFRAVEARLTLAVGKRQSKATEQDVDDVAAHVQAIVLECVAALDQLHKMLECERDRSAVFVMEAFHAYAGLDQAQAELLLLHARTARAASRSAT